MENSVAETSSEGQYFLGHDAVWSGRSLLTLQTNILSEPSKQLASMLIDPDDIASTFL
jgi:hypothetical protein